MCSARYPDNTPRTKEAYWYRTLFESHFPQARPLVAHLRAQASTSRLRAALDRGHAGLLRSHCRLAFAPALNPSLRQPLSQAATDSPAPSDELLCHLLGPQRAAMETVPGGPSVACSTATAALWDAAWAGNEDPSGALRM